ncbi:DNA-3-methyladenine glycosylase [Antricoccus suffuscus]|uniref:Putative 3-methyladenine DNA glycosylase n=1 Tax=Antricoccus suffuscus TaxID=1629062 RepID=A0A2T0ZWG6_9ACTN|nr:DNA-3-methyladenine glycosylase [Antricoccus suffuscus]PRZ40690.1 DNA-3-methyladenine glycosylase [Antricoccus suffuscus]
MARRRLTRAFFERSPVDVAPDLLGTLLTTVSPEGPVTLRITETEAYCGQDDPASHAYRGPSPRNEVMFGPAGHLYVYFTYGMHYCANTVCGPDGAAGGVLLRAAEVVENEALARARRPKVAQARGLARGPACLTLAAGIGRDDLGTDLCSARSRIYLRSGGHDVPIEAGPRVGVSRAAEVPWRFWIPGDPTVSAYKRSPRATIES